MLFVITFLTTCVKLMLIPTYRSTDFEVHRNWLAITHSLPVEKWYYEKTSEWTLDYPPFFAWFEFLLSHVATIFDSNMTRIDNINYASDKTILFQRLSVIVTDLVYIYGVQRICNALPKGWKRDVVLPILLITNCGLIMIDHVHFQYNGLMYGILLISISLMMQGKYEWAAFWFTFLLHMKHIYLYLAPAYFIYLLRHCCIRESVSLRTIFSNRTFKKLFQIGGIVTGVTALSLLPFIHHIPQLLSRLFPFKRGLSHAYWAPNMWALYNTADKIAAKLVTTLKLPIKLNATGSMTGGLVQEFDHSILPSISPLTTLVITTTFMLPLMIKLFFMKKDIVNFLRCLVLCGLISFLFGWHVHEKAILMVIIPLSVLAVMDLEDARMFLILSTVGHYSFFPLLFLPSLLFLKVLLLLLFTSYAFYSLQKIYMSNLCKYTLPLLSIFESLYVLGLSIIFLYGEVIHKILGLDKKLPFLPSMITSFYCGLGVVYCSVVSYLRFLKSNGSIPMKKD